MNYAGFWIRVLAYIIDFFIFFVPSTIFFGVVVGVSVLGEASSGLSGPLNIASYVIGWLIATCFESSKYQGTPGKMILGLKVCDENGDRISFMRATGRYFGKMLSGLILMIGFIMVGVTEKKQGLHDKLAGTLVIKK